MIGLTDRDFPLPGGWDDLPETAEHDFTREEYESYDEPAPPPSRTQWLRDRWWNASRTQRWAAAVGAPLAVVLLLGTSIALASDDSEQPTAAPATTSERRTAETTLTPTPTGTQTQVATVTQVLSGDTVVVLRNGVLETVRMIGIDAPEVAGSAAGQQCWSLESLQFATGTLLQKEIRLLPDPSQGEVDSAGMTLAYVLLLDGRDFSVFSAGTGHARNYTDGRPATKTAEIAAAEEAARTAALGLWGPPCNGGLPMPIPTADPLPVPTLEPDNDPRFRNCRQANAAGYGPYRRGVDPEYAWYADRNHDGIVCD